MRKFIYLLLALCSLLSVEAQIPVQHGIVSSSISQSLNVIAIEDQADITVPYNTAFASITFPTTVDVTLNDESVVVMSVTWVEGAYSPTAGGDPQVIIGNLTLPDGVTNTTGLTASVIVTVEFPFTEELFTTSGTWECPEGVTELEYIEGAGGGATGGSLAQIGSASGGGGGAYSRKNNLAVTPGVTYTYTVAAQVDGPLPSGSNLDGLDGNDTKWEDGSQFKAVGGKKGLASGASAGLGGAAADCVGDVKYSGGNGSVPTASRSGGGGGGASSSGAGGNAQNISATNVQGGTGAPGLDDDPDGGNGGGGTSGTAQSGILYSGGGGGRRNASVANGRGGNGAAGWIRWGYYGTPVIPPSAGTSYILGEFGQSNVIRSNGTPGAPYTGALNANIYVNSGTGFAPLEYGVNNNLDGVSTQFGPELSLGYTLSSSAPGEVDIIKYGEGGTSIRTEWNPANNGAGRAAVTRFLQGLNYRDAQGKTIHIKAVIFRQGEYEMSSTQNYVSVLWNGTVVLGTAAPSSGDGVDGDIFFDTTNRRFYGPKQAGATPWKYNSPIALSGTIHTGSGAPSNGLGSNGDHYYDTTNELWYSPKSGGAWPSSRNILNVFIEKDYKNYLTAWYKYLIDEANADGFDTSNMKLVISLVDSPFTSNHDYQTEVVAAQMDVALNFRTDNPSYSALCATGTYISTSDLACYDGLHFSGPSQITHGLRLAATITIP